MALEVVLVEMEVEQLEEHGKGGVAEGSKVRRRTRLNAFHNHVKRADRFAAPPHPGIRAAQPAPRTEKSEK